jgi:23S rRNA pseudouridine2457 synthase
MKRGTDPADRRAKSVSGRTHRYIKFFKPFGVLSQYTDEANRPTIGDYVNVPGVYAAGRLDKNSEGLMLLTNDGQLNHHITHPRYDHPKTYVVQVEGSPSLHALAQLRHGVDIKGEMTRPAEVDRLTTEPVLPPPPAPIARRQAMPTAWLRIVLREGRKRQIRHMTAAVGHPTLRLVRLAIGPLAVGDLEPGEWRELTDDELQAIWEMLGSARQNGN